MNKTAFTISVFLTTFVLMAVAGILYAVRAAEAPQAENISLPASIDPSAIDPSLLQALNEREAAYQQMIADANARLEQSQQQQLDLQSQVEALQNDSPAALPSSTIITPEQAAEIASDFLGQTSVYSVEVVSIQGETLYKVTFSSGDMVYVSLDGQIAGSASAQLAQNSGFSAAGGGGNAGVGSGEHESGEHDEHEGGEYDD